jgi:serine protease Do
MVVAQLKEHGHVTRGWLGVQVQPVTAGIAESLGMRKAEGAIVDQPQPDGPAAKAGIESGDVITAINGTPVKDSRELARTISMMAPNSSVKLEVLRKGESRSVTVALAQMPNEQQANAETGNTVSDDTHLGLSVELAKDAAGDAS